MEKGRITPSGGQHVHTHSPQEAAAMPKPTTDQRTAIATAASLAALQTALLDWIDSA